MSVTETTTPEVSAAPEAPSRWSLATLLRAAIVASIALGIGAALGYLIAHQPPPDLTRTGPAQAQPAGPAELAVVAPLRPGHALADFEVTAILAINPAGALRIACEQGEAGVTLELTLASDAGPAPTARAGPYAISYALRVGATHEQGERLAAALASILERNQGAPIPPGMSPHTSAADR